MNEILGKAVSRRWLPDTFQFRRNSHYLKGKSSQDQLAKEKRHWEGEEFRQNDDASAA